MKNIITAIALLLSMTGIFVSLAREELRCRLGLSSNECKPASLPATPEPSYVPPQLSKPFSPSPSPEPEPSPESTPVIDNNPAPMLTPEIEVQPSATPMPEIRPLEEAIPIPVIPPPSPSTSDF